MEEKQKKKITGINIIKKRLKKILENQGNYSEGIDTLLEITAGNIYDYKLARRDIEELEATFIEETTREGHVRLVEHPVFKTARLCSENIRKMLRELRLTTATAEGFDDDEMDDLINSVNDIEE